MKDMDYSTVIQIPCTKDSSLMKALVKEELKWAKVTGYQIKYTEKSGIQLSRLFKRKILPQKCDRTDCYICEHHSGKGTSNCKASNVVYEASCTLCEPTEDSHSDESRSGIYRRDK